MASPPVSIPLIDFSTASSDPTTFASAVQDALSSIGFLHIKNLGIKSDEVEAMFDLMTRFFALPAEQKSAVAFSEIGNGFTAMRQQNLGGKGQRQGDVKESFSFGKHSAFETQELPPVIDESKAQLQSFYENCHETASLLLDCFSTALGMPKNYLRTRHTLGKSSSLRLIHYPPPDPSSSFEPDDVRAGAHRDWGSLTLLFQPCGARGASGLEVFIPTSSSSSYTTGGIEDGEEGYWLPAPLVDDSVLVNVGLAMARWTNGRYTPTLHRVVVPENEDRTKGRMSIAYFMQADDEVLYTPLLGDGKVDDAAENVISSGELFEERLRATVTY